MKTALPSPQISLRSAWVHHVTTTVHRAQVYKHCKPAGQPLLAEDYTNVEDAEPVLMRHIQKSSGV